MQYLYDDGEFCQFMDTTIYEQIAIKMKRLGENKKWMLDGMMVDVLFHNGKAIGLEVPQVVELKIVETVQFSVAIHKEAIKNQPHLKLVQLCNFSCIRRRSYPC